jgi:hypothetical protein
LFGVDVDDSVLACPGLGAAGFARELDAVGVIQGHAGHQAAGVLPAGFERRNVLRPQAYTHLDADGLVLFLGERTFMEEEEKASSNCDIHISSLVQGDSAPGAIREQWVATAGRYSGNGRFGRQNCI